jgi:MFS family permease
MMNPDKRKQALQFILLFGLVSAFGDITYEGARSIYGPYLGYLGASAAVVGFVTGAGEFLGYALRLLSGYFIDRTRLYWPVTILGYGLLVAVPLLAMAGNWQIAVVFILLERIGKAIRSPAKDSLLSHATRQVGTGFGFGLHEALDQVGAFIGPLLFSAGLALQGGYALGFHMMWVPALLTVAVVLLTRLKFPDPASLEDDDPGQGKEAGAETQGLPRRFWLYALFTFFSVLGFASFQLISYHLQTKGIVAEALIPTLYAVAMGVDAVVAVLVGKLYDKKGMGILLAIPALSLPIPFLGFSASQAQSFTAVILWGAVMGIHETIMRAAIADMTGIRARGRAYGLFNTLYGVAWFLGSAVVGVLYDRNHSLMMGFIVCAQLCAVGVFAEFYRQSRTSRFDPAD